MTSTKNMTASDRGATPEHADQEPVILPDVDIFETEAGITLHADMPGVSRERLEVKVNGDGLSITGDMEVPVPDGMKALYADVRAKRYQRSFTLSQELDVDNVAANLKHGVLTLTIPKREKHKPRKIDVRAS